MAQEAAAPGIGSAQAGLSPGDQIAIRFYDLPDVGTAPLQVIVGADGNIHLPYAGTIRAEDLSPEALAGSIEDALRTKGIVKQPNVSVGIVSAVNMTIQVIGQVHSPKAIPVYSSVPVSFLLASAGGPTGLASHQLTILHHNDDAPTTIDYDPNFPTSAVMNTLVHPGEIVNVSPSAVIFVAGEVYRPGIYPIGGVLTAGGATPLTGGIGMIKEMTLLQALTQAGGVTAIAKRSKMHILRTENGKRTEIVVDQVKLSNGEVADPILHPNDIIYVPSSYVRMQTNNLFSTALAAIYAGVQLNNVANK